LLPSCPARSDVYGMAVYRITALKDVTVAATIWMQAGTKDGGRQVQSVETTFNLKLGKSRVDVASVISVYSPASKKPGVTDPQHPLRVGHDTQVPGLLWIERLKD